MQDALVARGFASSSTLSYVGSMQAVIQAALAIPLSRAVGRWGPRWVCLVAAALTMIGPVIAGSCSDLIIGLVFTQVSSFPTEF
jgi:MFS-type transporter involved in bile tolerance (Atg22 family)